MYTSRFKTLELKKQDSCMGIVTLCFMSRICIQLLLHHNVHKLNLNILTSGVGVMVE
jgi:hypothetical protein